MTTDRAGERKYVVRKGLKFVASMKATSPADAIAQYVAPLRNLGYPANPADYKAVAG